MFCRSGILALLALAVSSNLALAENVEIRELAVRPTKLPEGFDLLGARIGSDISQVKVALEEKGYKERETQDGKPDRGVENILCINGDCLTYNGARSFERTYRWVKDNETITVRVTSPPAGSLVYSIERMIDGNKTQMADFATLLKSAHAKYGTRAQWKSDETTKVKPGFAKRSGNGLACWGVRDGEVVEPHKKELMCNDNPHSKNKAYTDAYFYMKRNETYLEGRYIFFQLVDRQLMKDSLLPLKDLLLGEMDKRRAERKRKANSGTAPDL